MNVVRMIYITPTIQLAVKLLSYKNGGAFLASIPLVISIQTISSFLNISFLGVSIGFILLISTLIVLDFLTALIAVRHKGKQIKSSRITLTFLKFIMLFLWSALADHINTITGRYPLIQGITDIPLILLALREYISIGENIEKRYKVKWFMFTIVERIFDFLQFNFFSKIKTNKNEDKI